MQVQLDAEQTNESTASVAIQLQSSVRMLFAGSSLELLLLLSKATEWHDVVIFEIGLGMQSGGTVDTEWRSALSALQCGKKFFAKRTESPLASSVHRELKSHAVTEIVPSLIAEASVFIAITVVIFAAVEALCQLLYFFRIDGDAMLRGLDHFCVFLFAKRAAQKIVETDLSDRSRSRKRSCDR